MINLTIRHSVGQMLLMLAFVSIVSASHIEWNDFLKDPNPVTYGTLVESLKACNKAAKCIEVTPDLDAFDNLIALVKSGNPYAVDVAVLSRDLGLFDGANLEDVIEALGRLAETHPKLLLSTLQKYKFTGYRFEDTFVMLPHETVDDVDAKIRTVQKRIDSLSRVSDPSLKKERDNAILVLKRELGELQRIKKELRKTK